MRRSIPTTAPLITLLSPSRATSERAQDLLSALFGFKGQPLDSTNDDEQLNQLFSSIIPGYSHTWESIASQCSSSGAVIHMCSLDSYSTGDVSGPFSLLGITDTSKSTPAEAVGLFRLLFSEQLRSVVTNIKLRHTLGFPLTSSQLLTSISNRGLPLLDLPLECIGNADTDLEPAGLKEIVVPTYGCAVYTDGASLLSRLSNSQLIPQTVGVYQWTGSSTCIRPLPTALEDQRLPPPSLIFHAPHLDDVKNSVEAFGGKTAKIGFGGRRQGQLLVQHKDFVGMDMRFCSRTSVSSTFAEAQESLLAGSPEELQSVNTLLAAGENGQDDDRLGKGDCWVEVRSNLRRPSGFFQQTAASQNKRTAKVPDLPPE